MCPNDTDRIANSVDPDQTAATVYYAQTCLSKSFRSSRYVCAFNKWATSYQNQQNDCVSSEDSAQSDKSFHCPHEESLGP